jgi:hypothetical protein
MARRRRHARRHHTRENPVTNTELIVGGLVAAAVVGIGGYLIYQHYNSTSSTNAIAGSAVPQVAGVDANGNPTINGYPVATSS